MQTPMIWCSTETKLAEDPFEFMMPNYSNTPAPIAGGMPNMAAQPAAAVAMPSMAAQPAAQPVAQPAPVQPDPAREYYNGLIAQGYPQESAVQYTQQYYPAFQG